MARPSSKENRKSENSEKRATLDLRFVDFGRVQEPLKLQAFVRWVALPKVLREPRTCREFAKKVGVSQDTLTDWKKIWGFWREVEVEQSTYFREQSSDVLQALVNRAKVGRAAEVKLYLQYFMGFSEKLGVEEQVTRELTPKEREEHLEVLKRWGFPVAISRASAGREQV